jgi:AraC family transcriptional regulator, transcriptional activator of the genes for pyochelin and ferripyochelin receptors
MEKIFLAPQPLDHTTGNNQTAASLSAGMGHMQWVRLKSGIQLFSMDYTPHRPLTVEYAAPSTPLGFAFLLSGNIQAQLAGQASLTYVPNMAGVTYCPNIGGITESFATERIIRVGVFMDPEQLLSITDEQANPLTVQLENPASEMFRSTDRMTTAMRVTISQILNCPYRGAARSLFLESKVLELVAHKIGQIDAIDSRRPENRPLFLSDVERMQEAARLLTHDLENTPDLSQLARSVGLSPRSLYRYFHKVHGIPPFDYLRNHRLKTAMELLQSGEANVTEAAFRVGYSNLSHFTKSFKAMFGVSPSELLGHFPRSCQSLSCGDEGMAAYR